MIAELPGRGRPESHASDRILGIAVSAGGSDCSSNSSRTSIVCSTRRATTEGRGPVVLPQFRTTARGDSARRHTGADRVPRVCRRGCGSISGLLRRSPRVLFVGGVSSSAARIFPTKRGISRRSAPPSRAANTRRTSPGRISRVQSSCDSLFWKRVFSELMTIPWENIGLGSLRAIIVKREHKTPPIYRYFDEVSRDKGLSV